MQRFSSMIIIVGFVVVASSVAAQSPMQHIEKITPIHTTMKDLHARGGVPRGWKFLMPPGDAAAGRQVFASMKCFECHEIKGEAFPSGERKPGPELTGMGAHHPVEYFAESIRNPNRVIVEGTGYTGPDGMSKMPEYADTMTLRQFVDVVAYLRSLTSGGTDHGGHDHTGHQTGDSMKMDHSMGMK